MKNQGGKLKTLPTSSAFFFSYWDLGLSGLKMSNSQANKDALGIFQIAFVPSTHRENGGNIPNQKPSRFIRTKALESD